VLRPALGDNADRREQLSERSSMLGAVLEAIGVPAAAIGYGRAGTLVLHAANGELAALLDCCPEALAGEPAETLLPRATVLGLPTAASPEPIPTRLGALALPYRASVRVIASEPGIEQRWLVTFLPAAELADMPAPWATGLGPGELGATALEILDVQSEMVSRWRPDGLILYCNDAFARQCGRRLDEVIGANLVDLTPPQEWAQIQRNIARLSPACPASSYDHHIPGGGAGRERWQEWIDRVLFGEDGRLLGYLSVGRDITARKTAERRLAESEERLKLALEAGRQGVWEIDLRDGAVRVDAEFERLMRLPPGSHAHDLASSFDLYHPDDRGRVRDAIEPVLRGEADAFRVEGRRRAGDRGWVWVLNFGRVAGRDAAGRPARLVGTTIDISQRKDAETHLRESEQRLRLALDAGGLGVWECDLTTDRVRYDAICLARLGREGAEDALALADLVQLVHPRDRAKVRGIHAQFRRAKRAQCRIEYRIRRPKGGYAWIEEHAQVAERSRAGRPLRLVGVSADITARKEAEMRLAHLALHDPLTGLPNRRALTEALERAIARAQRSGLPLAVLVLDLDGFKAINDRHGHPAGDATLVEVAARLRRTIRRSDLVARLGGDEFAVIAGELKGAAPVVRLAFRLRAVVRGPIALPATTAAIDTSIGVAFFPGDGQTTEQLLARADAALYAAKREQVGCRFSEELPAGAP
jgi:diguanylate cyclase (GGDEF)-like protein/PAS domain S-box-containing protein